MEFDSTVQAALERLIDHAGKSYGQSRLTANFLLAWWNATKLGGFDFTDLWNVDENIRDDMFTVLNFVAKHHTYPDQLGYGEQFLELIEQHRPDIYRRQVEGTKQAKQKEA